MKTTTPSDITDEERAANEAEEAKRQEELNTLREKAHQEEIARAKLEGELEATKRATAQTTASAPQQYTEEQWQTLETQTGMTRQALTTSWTLAQQAADQKLAPVQREAEEAKKRAAELEKKIADYESRGVATATETKFYTKNPAYTNYKDKIDEFVNAFPESDRKNPEKLANILDKAKVYVKGLAGGKMREDGRQGSQSIGGSEEDAFNDSEEERIDFTGLHKVDERRTVSDLHRNSLETMKDRPDLAEALKKSMTADGTTVQFDFEGQFKAEEARKRKARGS